MRGEPITAVFRIHHGIVQLLGIADTALTTTKSQQRSFIKGFDEPRRFGRLVGSRALFQIVPAERHASALEEMQVTFPLQLDNSPQIFLAPVLMASCSPSKIAIVPPRL